MESQFYSKTTGRLGKVSKKVVHDSKNSKKDASSVYSISSDDDNSTQYPLGTLTPHQKKFISSFLKGITGNNTVEIDDNTRAIHWIGVWSNIVDDTTVSCSLVQPNIINATVHFRGLTYGLAVRYMELSTSTYDSNRPSLRPTANASQVMGRYAVPLADSFIDGGYIKESNVSWSNIVMGQTQPIFVIACKKGAFECAMTYNSCLIMKEVKPPSMNIAEPVSGTLNFSFRSVNIITGTGTGPALTVHGSGVMQYQGSVGYLYAVTTGFRECIHYVMNSDASSRFLRSLNIIRSINPTSEDASAPF